MNTICGWFSFELNPKARSVCASSLPQTVRVCVRSREGAIFAASARLCFFRLVADVSLARGHSPHSADMGKGPVFYSEIGKKARGSLFFFFFWSKLLVFNACWGFLSAVRFHCVSIQRDMPFLVSRKEGFFFPLPLLHVPKYGRKQERNRVLFCI